MKEKIKSIVSSKKWRAYLSPQAISLYVIALVALSVTWTSTNIVQRNYRLQKEVSTLQQELENVRIEVENQKLQNAYYASDAYLELAAKRQLNRGEPGEKLLIVPRSVANSLIPPKTETSNTSQAESQLSNWQAWLEFLSGRSGVIDTRSV